MAKASGNPHWPEIGRLQKLNSEPRGLHRALDGFAAEIIDMPQRPQHAPGFAVIDRTERFAIRHGTVKTRVWRGNLSERAESRNWVRQMFQNIKSNEEIRLHTTRDLAQVFEYIWVGAGPSPGINTRTLPTRRQEPLIEMAAAYAEFE